MDWPDLKLKTFRDGVYEALKASILKCEFLPGQRLLEKELVSQIGTSRTPIREAIIKLEQEGLVEKLEGKGGYFVAAIRQAELEEIFGIREVLENYCLTLCIDRMGREELSQLEQVIEEEERLADPAPIDQLVRLDTKFHEILYRASGNRKLCEILNELKSPIYRFRTLSYHSLERKRVRLSNHRQLFLALKKRDRRQARKLIHDTISRSKAALLKEIEKAI